ncbi:MAG TPA: Spy/CpxP family protein refolding chaperone [Blastocatellia bacterium]|nr:Spy/CpxP family protein refolding chaperone [Blastocatellia bacterium]
MRTILGIIAAGGIIGGCLLGWSRATAVLAGQAGRPTKATEQLRSRTGVDRPAPVPAERPEAPGPLQEQSLLAQPQAQTPVLNRMAIIRLLNLSPEQLRRIQDVRRRLGPHLEKARQEVEDRRDALREATYGETFNPSLVEQRLRELIEAQSELIRLETQLEIEFRNVLTPEQLAEFRKIRDEELAIRRMRREARERERRLQERLRRALQRPPQM